MTNTQILLSGAAAALLFVTGHLAGQETAEQRHHEEAVSVVIGIGCSEDGNETEFVAVAHEEDAFPWPCQSIERHTLVLVD